MEPRFDIVASSLCDLSISGVTSQEGQFGMFKKQKVWVVSFVVNTPDNLSRKVEFLTYTVGVNKYMTDKQGNEQNCFHNHLRNFIRTNKMEDVIGAHLTNVTVKEILDKKSVGDLTEFMIDHFQANNYLICKSKKAV